MKTITKHLLWGLMSASLLLPTTAAADTFSFSVSPRFDDVGMEVITGYDGCDYTRLACDGCAYLSETGLPDIPYRIYEIEVPTYSNGFSVSLESCSMGGDVWLNAPVWPHQPPMTYNDNPADLFTPLSDEALAADIQPLPVVFDDGFQKGRIHTVRIGVPLYSHSSGAMSLTPYESVGLQLEYQLCPPEEMCHRPIGLQSEVFECTLRGAQDELIFEGNLLEDDFVGSAVDGHKLGRYYIITPEDFADDLDMLVALKRAKGLDVRVHCIEDIVASTDGCDDAERLRNWLKCNVDTVTWQNHVLLIGGKYTDMPARRFRKFTDKDMSRFADLPFDHLFYIPSDAYYSDLNSHFSLLKGKDGNYSCFVNRAPFSGVLPVGRIPANSTRELHNYLNKLYHYELFPGNGNAQYLGQGLAIRQNQFANSKQPTFFKDYSFNGNVTWLDDPGGDSFADNHPTGEEAIDAISKAGIISIIGHATPIFMCVSGNYANSYRYINALSDYVYFVYSAEKPNSYQLESNNSFDKLKNINSPNILFTVGCNTASIDSYEDKGLSYNMGSAFTCAGNFGGVAFIGNTRPLYIDYGPPLEAGFGKYLNEDISIGEVHLKSIGVINHRYSQFMRMLFGDPEFKVWNGTPSFFNLNPCINSSNIVLQSPDIASSSIILNDGNSVLQKIFVGANENEYSISKTALNSTNGFDEQGICAQFTLTKKGFIPFSRLVIEDAVINKTRSFIVNYPVTLQHDNGNSLTIKQEGIINLRCLSSFSTDNALTIEHGGKLSINADMDVSLKEDLVKNGGKLEIISNSTILGPGFSVEKGGSLTIKTHEHE